MGRACRRQPHAAAVRRDGRSATGRVGATVTTAVIGNGAYADGIGWGVEMAQLVESISGTPITFGMSAFGTFGQVVWISVAADAAAADAVGNAVNSNADDMGRLSAIADLFGPPRATARSPLVSPDGSAGHGSAGHGRPP